MAKSWPAHYLDGKTSGRAEARVRLLKRGLGIKPKGKKALLWPYSEIRQEQGSYEGEPLRLERGGPLAEALVVADQGFLRAVHLQLPGPAALRFHDPRKRRDRRLFTLYAGLATALLALAFHYWIIPALASSLAGKIPLSVEKNLSATALDLLAPENRRRLAPRLQGVIQDITARLTEGVESPYDFQVLIVEHDMVNAFSLPGGTVVLMTGLLEKTQSPEELAGILAHELQHCLRKDALRQLLQSSQTGLLLSVVSGDASGVVFGAQAAAAAAELRYSREDEAAADEEGMRMVIRAGIAPQGMVQAFEMLKSNENLPSYAHYLSGHPGIDTRISRLKELAASSKVKIVPIQLPEGRTWKSLVAFD